MVFTFAETGTEISVNKNKDSINGNKTNELHETKTKLKLTMANTEQKF